jgi:hypothetical protein
VILSFCALSLEPDGIINLAWRLAYNQGRYSESSLFQFGTLSAIYWTS